MPEINKVNRSKNIKQISRIEDLKPATEKTVTKVIPKIQNETSLKAEMDKTIVEQPINISQF